ncbi:MULTISPECIES: cytochrome P450 [unclassified Frankia]|uniref:cytochrome P450 n=1 Tax=unclassified Frankia TaxID=2632575 RepID=UPI002AD2D820|nr:MULTISPECIES: cytochrome P450 [unclassified Frankia]
MNPATVGPPVADPPTVVFDGFDPAHRADPYPRYAMVREATTLYRSALGPHLVTRYAECAAALSEPAWSHAGEAELFHPDVDQHELPASFLWMDPPDHTRLRGLVSKAFTARRVLDLRPRIAQIVDGLLDAALAAGEVDAVESLAYPLPLTVICELLGVPAADHDLIHRCAPALARGFDPDLLLTQRERTARSDAAAELLAYFAHLIASRRAEPAADLVSELGAVQERGDVLTAQEMLATCVTLLVAGHETTVNLVGNGLLALLRHPGQLALLRARPELAAPAVDELLRHDSPVHMTTRVARRGLMLGGQAFAPGEGIVLLIGSANRDPRAFDRPDELDLARYADDAGTARHLTFSLGIHYCLGAPLARLEMEVLLTAIVRRVRRLLPGSTGPTYKPNLVLRGLAGLTVQVR